MAFPRNRGPYEDEAYRLIGQRVRAMRDERGITQQALADAIGTSVSNIQNAEIGASCSVTLLMKIAEHFDVTLDDLCPVVTAA